MGLFVLPSRRASALEADVRELQERHRALQRQLDEQDGRLEALTATALSVHEAQLSFSDHGKAVRNVVH